MRLEPRNLQMRTNLALALELQGPAAEAERELQQVLRQRTPWVPARLQLGNLYAARGDAVAAEREYRAALAVAPRSAEAWFLLGEREGPRAAQPLSVAHDAGQWYVQFALAQQESVEAVMGLVSRESPESAKQRFPIDYGEDVLREVLAMHAGSEDLPGHAGWIEDHMGGRVVVFRQRLLPQIHAFCDLRDKRILDFGCGTGSTTVVLAEAASGGSLVASDIDPRSLEIAKLRFEHHGIHERVALRRIAPVRNVGDLPFADESFDFILANGVLEHVVPFEARKVVILEIWRTLNKRGIFFLSETPNVLWPIDRHTTGLPLIPWLPSPMAHRCAVMLGRHQEGADLNVRGRRGMSYWGIVRPLKRAGLPFEVLNITRTKNRLVPAGLGEETSWKRRMATAVLEGIAARPLSRLGVPTVALAPFIEFLALRKPA